MSLIIKHLRLRFHTAFVAGLLGVLDVATVWLGFWSRHWFPDEQRFDCCFDEISRSAWISTTCGAVVDCALINQDALLVDYEHVWRGFHAVELADCAGVVVDPCRCFDAEICELFSCSFGFAI